jgi:hypothetical protein
MRVTLTGWNSFLSKKLREVNSIEWTQNFENTDILFLMGSPIFTGIINKEDSKVLHNYVEETKKLILCYSGPIVFASTTGVNDIHLDHSGHTPYNLCKLYLENYIINTVDNWSILRIGTIISDKLHDIEMMRKDKIQQKILNKDFTNMPLKNECLHVDEFVNETIDLLMNFKCGIKEYDLKSYSLSQLISITKLQ